MRPYTCNGRPHFFPKATLLRNNGVQGLVGHKYNRMKRSRRSSHGSGWRDKELLDGADDEEEAYYLSDEAHEAVPPFGEVGKFMPVVSMTSLIAALYVIYVMLHCVPRLQLDMHQKGRDAEMRYLGVRDLIVFHMITAVMLYCYVLSVITLPGTIPTEVAWRYNPEDDDDDDAKEKEKAGASDEEGGRQKDGTSPMGAKAVEEIKQPGEVPEARPQIQDTTWTASATTPRRLSEQLSLEKKQTGARRHCKWCLMYKPDRAHHCRVCKRCVLRMDHHCPWVYNCIGFRNYKYFFLLLVYAALDCHYIAWTMLGTVQDVTQGEEASELIFLLAFGELLAATMAMLVTCFLLFHIWLLSRGMTTIEFCEKKLKQVGYDDSKYDRGIVGNLKQGLGPYMCLWLFPGGPLSGDGVDFSQDKSYKKAGGGRRRRSSFQPGTTTEV